jgi:hypothetical protein
MTGRESHALLTVQLRRLLRNSLRTTTRNGWILYHAHAGHFYGEWFLCRYCAMHPFRNKWRLICDGRAAQLSDLQIGPALGPIAPVAALGRPIGATVQTYQFSDMKQLLIVLFGVSVAEIAVQSLDSLTTSSLNSWVLLTFATIATTYIANPTGQHCYY